MKMEDCSTFELAERMLSQNQDWVLVRVGPYGASFENEHGELALSRREMIRNLKQVRMRAAAAVRGPFFQRLAVC